jgi:glycosyltransferase involved in cell wall biosynthesis
MGMDSELVLSSDNERTELVRSIYSDAKLVNFFAPGQLLNLRRSLAGRAAFFTMISPKMLPLFLSLPPPKIFYFHATYDYTYSKRGMRDAYYELLHEVLIHTSTITAATQPGLARQIKEKLGVHARVLPHPPYSPISPSFFAGEKEVRLPFKKGEYFLNFGEISRESKGTRLLIEAVQGTQLQVVLAGRREGVESARNVFHINRWVEDDELYWLIKNCRAVVLPYLLRSQFSGCLALAFHFKKPVLAPDTEAFSGWVEEGRTGWLFRCGDASNLQRKMEGVAFRGVKFSQGAIAAKEKEQENATARTLGKLLAGAARNGQ